MKRHALFLMLIATLIIAASGCSQSNMATVTIDTGLINHASIQKPALIDRIIALCSLSSPVQADPPTSSITSILLTVSAPDMDLVSMEIPTDTGILTLEIEAGSSRRFSVTAYRDDFGAIFKDYGGITTIDLESGETRTVPIFMGPLPLQVTWPGPLTPSMFGVGLSWNISSGADGYNIYRAELADGPYELITSLAGNTTTTYFDEDVITDGTYTYYYKVGGYNELGEGTQSDYAWANPGP